MDENNLSMYIDNDSRIDLIIALYGSNDVRVVAEPSLLPQKVLVTGP